MCTMSMIMDHYDDSWGRKIRDYPPPYTGPPYTPVTQQEVDEFRRLLERARQYDKDHGQPDCELEEKRKKIKELAEQLGVDVSFV